MAKFGICASGKLSKFGAILTNLGVDRLNQRFSTCGMRTPGGARAVSRGYAKVKF
jgi:hypothetical protein